MIKLLRCDDRLIHGQCMASIVKQYDIKHIIVIDDATASNAIMKRIFEMAVPKNIKAFPLTCQQAPVYLKKALENDIPTLVLTRLPSTMLQMYQEVPELPKDFNIANVAAKDGTYKVTSYARCDQKEIDAIKTLDQAGVHIWFNTIQGQSVTEWNSIKQEY